MDEKHSQNFQEYICHKSHQQCFLKKRGEADVLKTTEKFYLTLNLTIIQTNETQKNLQEIKESSCSSYIFNLWHIYIIWAWK